MATIKLRQHGHEVKAVGKENGMIGDLTIQQDFSAVDKIDTVTLYLNPLRQKEYYDKIIALKPRRIIFNPGAENPELEKLANQNGIITENSCTLVLLGTGQF